MRCDDNVAVAAGKGVFFFFFFCTRNHLEVKFDDACALNNLIMTAK